MTRLKIDTFFRRESMTATKNNKTKKIMAALGEAYPDAECALHFRTPFQLLVATILSAQCTDERVNKVTPELFKRSPDAGSIAELEMEELEELIRSTGFFRNKAKSISGAAKILVQDYKGEVPSEMEDLVKLPGVARKTANVILGTAYGKNEGIVVDTHVRRLSGRLGLSDNQDPVKIERDLMDLFPREQWTLLGHQLILHGRAVCKARKPNCGACSLQPHCPKVGIE
jgi:endonuclease-3